ncbi:MAG: DNA polymerase III subunit epsilon [Alphaproteobacteria bacterium]|nr:MAG: DNA polymerase III subunit epsilon [Alphaproteobacteria bacterium]
MREIVLDTETTGLDPNAGHRVVELAALELLHGTPTGRSWHKYFNPDRDMPEEAFRVHGISASFLESHPRFEELADSLLEFLGDARLVIHNADFDMRFLRAEFQRAGRPFANDALCTMILARRLFPGAQASLDALCKRFGVDNSHRTLHGAMVDVDLLTAVYIELTGGRQRGLGLAAERSLDASGQPTRRQRTPRPARPHQPTEEELAAHAKLLDGFKTPPVWRQ